jgi:hypothetical protein
MTMRSATPLVDLMVASALLVAGGGIALAGGQRATFIDGIYAMEGRCESLVALDAGGPRTVETVPETLTAEGFKTWEGGCDFAGIEEEVEGRVFVATMTCTDGADEWKETDTFTVDPADRSITVAVDGESSRYVYCGSGKGN